MDQITELKPPHATKRPSLSRHHGIETSDPYAWLRADNWQQVMRDPDLLSGDIRAYLEAENAYTDAVMADTAKLQDELFAELKGRIKEEDSTVPAPDGPYAYYLSYIAGGQHSRYCRVPRDLSGPAAVLVDGNREAEGQAFFRFGGITHSPDHRLIAWSADHKGSELYRLHIRDVATGKDLPEIIENTTGSAVWSSDSQTIFYVVNDDNHRPCKVLRHRIGRPAEEDVLVYEESDPGFFVGVGKTQSQRFILIDAHDHESSEVRLIEAARPDSEPRLIAPRHAGVEYDVDHRGDELLILTNRDGAEDYKIVAAPVEHPSAENWRDLVAHEPGRLILAHIALRNWLIRLDREDSLPRLVVRDMGSGGEHVIALDEEAYSLGFGEMLEYDTDTLRFTYSSMTTPAEVFDYDLKTRSRVLRKVQEVPSGHDPDLYITRRLHAPAHDGDSIPITLLYRKGTRLDGSAPLWLYGYGSYGITIPAAFNTNILSLVDRGFIYAIAHTRGGKDKGYRWYKDGKREKKPNTFRDFIACAEYLVEQKLTSSGSIVAQGGSAGGMLMGVVANMAPDLFRGIIAEVPFVDVLTTMLDDGLPLTPPEWQEWGNPIASREAYDLIASYSPYDNVGAKAYPHILAIGGLTDPRVTYWEPAKWVARLRELKTDGNLLLLRTHMGAGHAGAPGRFDRLKEVAFVYAFGIKIAGLA